MKTILLPGYSIRNREWADEIAAKIDGVEVHAWAHWDSGGTLNAARELAAITRRIGENRVSLLAKSVGCRIAVQIVLDRPDQIEQLILCGLPGTQVESRADFDAALRRLPIENILVVQNRNDPYAAFSEVQHMIQSVHPGVRVVAGDREDHHYPYPDLFRDFLAG